MPLLKTTTVPQPPRYASPAAPFHFCRHNGKAVLELGEKTTGILETGNLLICADTRSALDDEITRLNLTPLPLTKGEQAAALFGSLPAEVQTAFGPAFQAISALPESTPAERKAKHDSIAAVTVPPALADAKAALLAIFA